MRGLALVLLCCAGCDLLFDIRHFDHAAGDAAPPDGKQIDDSPCSLISMLVDSFTLDDLDAQWPGSYADPPGSVSVQSGFAVVTTGGPDSYGALTSSRYYDIREGSLTVKLGLSAQLGDDDAVSLLLTSREPDTYASVMIDAQKLTFKFHNADAETLIASVPYEIATDPYLRVSYVGSKLVLEMSADGTVYAAIGDPLAGVDLLTFVSVELGAYRGVGTAQYQLRVDQVGDHERAGHACPVGLMHDDFATDTLGPLWQRSFADDTMTIEVVGGEVVETTGTKEGTTALLASSLADLTDGSFSVQIPHMLMSTVNESVELIASTPASDDSASFDQTNGFLSGRVRVDGSTMVAFESPYDPATMSWWRLSHDTATHKLVWETSGDGRTWDFRGTAPELHGVDRVDLGVAVHSTGAPVIDHASIDHVNTP